MSKQLPPSSKTVPSDASAKLLPRITHSRYWLLGLLFLIIICVLTFISGQPKQAKNRVSVPSAIPPHVTEVKVQRTAHGYQLLRGGKPYFLKGGGGLQYYDQLRAAGANTVRLWSTDYATPLLDEAQRQGLTVMLGLWLEPEDKHFTYYDPKMVAVQRVRVRQQVLRFRNHPALLMWSVGNEVEQSAYGPRMFEAVNDLARMIHELDPYHPVTVALAHDFIDRAKQLQQVAPEVDILSVNVYSELSQLPHLIKRSQWQGPYIVSEFGPWGYWQTKWSPWSSPLEPSSGDKADSVRVAYRRGVLADSAHCLGAYAFYWGYKFEYTATWLSLFGSAGDKTETVDELQHFWTGHYPPNRAPHLTTLRLPGLVDTLGARVQPGQKFQARTFVTDPEGDSLTVQWEMTTELPRAYLSEEIATPTEIVPGCVLQAYGMQAIIQAPQKPGRYRLFVRVFDGHGSMATANIPIQVKDPSKLSIYSLLSNKD